MECKHEFEECGLESDGEGLYIVYECKWCGKEVYKEVYKEHEILEE